MMSFLNLIFEIELSITNSLMSFETFSNEKKECKKKCGKEPIEINEFFSNPQTFTYVKKSTREINCC